jgi:hypothetical protein
VNSTYARANRFADAVLGYLESDGGKGYFVRFNGKIASFSSHSEVVCILSEEPTLYWLNVNEAIIAYKKEGKL